MGFFGASVSLSGNLALVGAIADDALGDESGAAYVFGFDGTSWTQQAKLTASDGVKLDFFGSAVVLSGNMALIAADGVDDGKGAVYMFVFDGVSWTQQAKFLASDSVAGDIFGSSLALSGNSLLVGARGTPGEGQGGAYVFTFDGTTWNQQAKLTAEDGVISDYFGVSVALDENLALIGASHKDDALGAAYVFGFDGTTWSQQAKLTSPKPTRGESFGNAVALSGTRAIISSPQFNRNPGTVYEFSSNGSTWRADAQLSSLRRRYGGLVRLQRRYIEGTRLLVGAEGADSGTTGNTGAVYSFSCHARADPGRRQHSNQ